MTRSQHMQANWMFAAFRGTGIRSSRLSQRTQDVIGAAVRRATKGGVSESTGKVVAELGLGFWSKLLSDNYNRTLWEPCLKDAFPNAKRRRLHQSVENIVALRNRIAHHEPIHQRHLANDFTALLAVSSVIAPGLEAWTEELPACDLSSVAA